MADDPKAAKQIERRQRLDAALRANLKRRKAQARQRAAEVAEESSERGDASVPAEPPERP